MRGRRGWRGGPENWGSTSWDEIGRTRTNKLKNRIKFKLKDLWHVCLSSHIPEKERNVADASRRILHRYKSRVQRCGRPAVVVLKTHPIGCEVSTRARPT